MTLDHLLNDFATGIDRLGTFFDGFEDFIKGLGKLGEFLDFSTKDSVWNDFGSSFGKTAEETK